MTLIENIEIEKIDFLNEKSKEFKECLKIVPDLLKFLPKKIKYKVSFILKDTNADIANGLRRVILNETPVKSLDYDEYKDTNISDPYILSDFLKKQIELIPINQDINYDNIKITLDIENKSDEIINIKTSDFTITENEKKIPVSKIMSENITIIRLRPTEFLKIKKIIIKEGIGRNNAAAFSNVSNIYYLPLNITPLNPDDKKSKSSMVENPSKFKIGYSTHRNIEKPLIIIEKACDILIDKCNKFIKEFENIKDTDKTYYSDLIELETKNTIKEIHFKNENWTLVNLVARFCFILTKSNIKFVTSSIIHPEKEIGIVKITHPEFSTLIKNSLKKIIEEYSSIKNHIK